MDGGSQTGLFPKGSWAFSSQATQSHRAVPDSPHSSDTCINGILAWDCRCWKVIVQKQLCLSYSLFFSLSYFTSVSFTDSSILSHPISVHPPPTYTQTHKPSLFCLHSFSHYWSVSALENCCACRAGVITSGINHFPCAWLQEAQLIPALLYTPSKSSDRDKPYWLLLKTWYNSKCLAISGGEGGGSAALRLHHKGKKLTWWSVMAKEIPFSDANNKLFVKEYHFESLTKFCCNCTTWIIMTKERGWLCPTVNPSWTELNNM